MYYPFIYLYFWYLCYLLYVLNVIICVSNADIFSRLDGQCVKDYTNYIRILWFIIFPYLMKPFIKEVIRKEIMCEPTGCEVTEDIRRGGRHRMDIMKTW